MKIEPNQPHIIFEIDALGNIKSEACNYPNQNGVCQGELATQPFEQALADNKLIPPSNQLKIPAELMRKGRLDEVWFAGLPNLEERQEILQIHFNQPKRVKPEYLGGVKRLIPLLADRTELFSGAELASLVTQGLTNIYLDGRAGMPQSSDFIPLAQNLVPLAKSQPEQHEKVMQWSLKARNTSSYEPNNKTHSTTVSQC